ncbi:MAG: acylphosphatase [Hungatella hathewayi]|nr:acylphosphatase [Hungatella hathewayi]
MGKTDIVRKHIFVSGRVQGVGFRYRTYYLAESLGLTGWVRNLYDERVEMELQGHEEDMNQLFRKLQENTFIYIEHCEVERIPVIEERGFHVRG